MKIHVDGTDWTVEESDAGTLAPEAEADYCGLRFRPEDGTEDEGVEIRWIPRPERLTPTLANRLFLLAGERRWRDPRDGSLYHVTLEAGAWPGDEAPGDRQDTVKVRFRDDARSFTTAYDLDRPLGLAGSDELSDLLDRASAALARVREDLARTAVNGADGSRASGRSLQARRPASANGEVRRLAHAEGAGD